MCGIAGILNFDPRVHVDAAALQRMQQVLQHRGPDDEGRVVLGNLGLAHRRLAIIDLRSGQQPMASADQRLWISYNGEIYNYRALQAEFKSRGCAFRTQSDTEVILNAYTLYGEVCVERLRGMFAFVLWDRGRQTLLLARDRLGIKPLYYACTQDQLLFASEIKAILAAGVIPAELNRDILPEFLATRFVAGPETFYRGIYKLLPGRTLTWSVASGLRQRRYWQLPARLDETRLPIAVRAVQVRDKLQEAIRSHLVSDVPVGLFLSGGIDSSGLAALMAPMVAEPIHSFAMGFADRGYSELYYARLAAKAVGAVHHEVTITAADFFTALPRLVWHEDEPIAFPSSIALYFVARLARPHVKVVMTGEGADELFLGYNRYRVAYWNARLGSPYYRLLPGAMRARVSRGVRRLPRRLRRYAARSFLATPANIRGLFYENFAVFPQDLQQRLLNRQAGVAARDPYREELRCYKRAPGGMLEGMSYADLQTYLVELLMKQDQMSMAASVESRVPFLDHEFVEQVAALPGRYKLRGWQTKAVLRTALRDLVPREILGRRKMGFPVPLGSWLRGRYWPLVEHLLLGARARDRGLFNLEAVAQLAQEHRSGAWDHGDRLWLLMNLEIWQRIFLEGEAPESLFDGIAPQAALDIAA
ncbi:MAG TPA: asparagine synthase (glutamine-hydrolyzing) [Gammaproteobacteria bacterium]|nr:asparagine synthase (glutamine-hydrolyzing) [Gammaproteobacteria bacterium]